MTFLRRRLSRKRRRFILEQLEQRELLASDAISQLIGFARQAARLELQDALIEEDRIEGPQEATTDTAATDPVAAPAEDTLVNATAQEGQVGIQFTSQVAAALGQNQKPRLIVLTDIGGGDPDDEQSLVRLLTYSNKFDIEGLVAGASTNGTNTTSVHLAHNIVNHYESVRSNLLQHEAGFPTASYLRSKVVVGQALNGQFGNGYDTSGSNLIIQAVDKADARPVNIAIWGGSTDLAQALWRVQQTRSADEVDQFVSKIRVAWIEQNSSDAWIKSTFPNLWVVSNLATDNFLYQAPFRGMYLGGDASLTTADWVRTNVNAHQPYGNPYPTYAAGHAMKEGDTPTWFYFLPSDLSDPDHPEWGGWGGRYVLNGNLYSPATDYSSDGNFGRNTVNRWREEYQNDFAARMDWTTAPVFSQANHNPVAVIDQPNQIRVTSGQTVSVNAAASWDPDGNPLTYEWFQYREAGTYPYAVTLNGAESSQVQFTAPSVSATQTVHVILKLRDNGEPNLFDYQRVVVTIDPAEATVPTFTPTPTPTPTPTIPTSGTAQAVVDLRFNEASGNVAADSSGKNNKADLLNTEDGDWVAGVDGTAIRLDSNNERVRIANSPSWSGQLESFSISAWIRFDDIAGADYNSIVSVGNWNDQRINLYPVNGTLQLYAASDDWTTSAASTGLPFLWNADGAFHHLVVVKDASSHSASIFVDGQLVGRDDYASGSVDLSGWDLSFCGNSLGQKQLACSLDNASFYHGALTDSEIQQLFASGSAPTSTPLTNASNMGGAVVDLVFGEGSGTVTQDRSGNGNHGSLVNTEFIDWVPGFSETALRLDGTNERVSVPTSSSWAIRSETFTVSAWVRFDDPANSNYKSMVSVGNWQDQRLNIYPLNGQLVFTGSSSDQSILATSPWQPYLWQPDGKFHHIVAVKDQSTARLYIDGQLVGTDDYAAGSVDLRGWDLSFCANSIGNKGLACTINAGALYHEAITTTQVVDLYQAGPTGNGNSQTTPIPKTISTNGPYIPPGTVLDLRFDEGSGNVTADQSGNGNNASLLATRDSSWANSAGTKGIQLDGVYQQARVAPAGNWARQLDDLTLSMWVRFDSLDGIDYRILASVGDWNDQRLALYPVAGKLQFAGKTNGSTNVLVRSMSLPFLQQPDGQFHNIVLVKDKVDGTASIYVDGFLVGREQADGPLDLRGWGFALGGDSSGHNPIPVTIASTKLYHRVLANREISDLFLNGSH